MNIDGWKNYETWTAARYLINTMELWKVWDAEARAALLEAEGDKKEAGWILANKMQKTYQEAQAPVLHGLYRDLLTSALLEIDWRAIAASYLEDITL